MDSGLILRGNPHMKECEPGCVIRIAKAKPLIYMQKPTLRNTLQRTRTLNSFSYSLPTSIVLALPNFASLRIANSNVEK